MKTMSHDLLVQMAYCADKGTDKIFSGAPAREAHSAEPHC